VKLALTELRRRPGRFSTAALILTLIAILLMFLGGLLDGLIAASTGAIRAQDADAIVYSDTAQASFVRSRIEPQTRAAVEGVDGVTEVGGIGNVQLGARIPGKGPRDLAGVALFGYELAPTGVPDAPPSGQAWADDVLEADGVEVGMVIELGPARSPIEIVGFVDDTTFNGQASLWASPDTWREVLGANRPDAQLGPDVWQGLIVRGDGDDLPAAIDAATEGATESFTVDGAINAIPGHPGADGHLQPDHRRHDRDCARRHRVVLRAADRRANQPVRRAEGARGQVVDDLRRPRRAGRGRPRRSPHSSPARWWSCSTSCCRRARSPCS
jgi:putative ABC transport system permease protein